MLLFAVLRSLSLETTAMFVAPGQAEEATLTASVMAVEAPGSLAPGLLQLTTWSAAEQVQPGPIAET